MLLFLVAADLFFHHLLCYGDRKVGNLGTDFTDCFLLLFADTPSSLFHLQTGFGGSFPVSFVDDLFLFGKGFFQDSILLFLCFGKYPGSLGLNICKLFIRLASRFKRVVDVPCYLWNKW